MRMLTLIWNVFYWTAFVMCWAVLPFMMNYVNSGEFTVKGKMQRAVKKQVRDYIMKVAVGMVVVVYLWWNNAFERYSLIINGMKALVARFPDRHVQFLGSLPDHHFPWLRCGSLAEASVQAD